MPVPETQTYVPLVVVAILATALAAVMLSLSGIVTRLNLGGRKRSPIKDQPYECGMPILSEAHTKFSIKFYIVAMLFILFDVESVFLFAWAVKARSHGMAGLANVALYDG